MEILLKPKETGYTVAQGEAREGNREPNVAESEDKRVVHEALVTASLYKFSLARLLINYRTTAHCFEHRSFRRVQIGFLFLSLKFSRSSSSKVGLFD